MERQQTRKSRWFADSEPTRVQRVDALMKLLLLPGITSLLLVVILACATIASTAIISNR